MGHPGHPERPADIDLGLDHKLWFNGWHPDRDLNPQYDGIPDVEKAGATVSHLTSTGEECASGIMFAGHHFSTNVSWQVVSWEPLTLAPSLLCRACGDHGFIREGRWVEA